ncbi:hypothetical protein NL676_029980 [Syzygium grande]|nr:hypothetical protein NL676_029980 [Syzygium grande]
MPNKLRASVSLALRFPRIRKRPVSAEKRRDKTLESARQEPFTFRGETRASMVVAEARDELLALRARTRKASFLDEEGGLDDRKTHNGWEMRR